MSYDATVFKVMIASPGDVSVEKNTILEVIHEQNAINSDARRIVLLPASWDPKAQNLIQGTGNLGANT